MDSLLPGQRDVLINATAQMRRAGVRRLMVLSGETHWSRDMADAIRASLPGDWLWVGEADRHATPDCSPAALKMLLGREFSHGIFDATAGLAVDALAALAGTLTAGSWLVLLVPEWVSWSATVDNDSLRWSGSSTPIITPVFIDYFRHRLMADPEVTVIRQHQPMAIAPLQARGAWQAASHGPTTEQRALLERLIRADAGVYVLTAPRGRGKSTLAGMLAAEYPGNCWITAPAKATAAVVERYADNQARFFAPDALLEHCQHHPPADWLLVDEAAAIALPLLRRLIDFFPRVLLTTTVQGYEGSGHGFLLKFCPSLDTWHNLTLEQPLRWANNDPLERWLGETLLFNDPPQELESRTPPRPLRLARFSAKRWRRYPAALAEFYRLLSRAHYRTTPLDLRRLTDAPGQHFISAYSGAVLTGALWWVNEGGLSPGLAHDVWAGRRRPPGNLVAQSLAAHGSLWAAPQLRSRRISRIAVTVPSRRQGIGRALITQALATVKGLDFISVSFGFTDELWQFWRAAGFQLVHMGTHQEASSGCYSAMALIPLTPAGHNLVRQGAAQYARDSSYGYSDGIQQPLNEDDWRTLAGFAFAHRPAESCQVALRRLLNQSDLPLPALRLWLEQGLNLADTGARIGIHGKKALLQRWRDETSNGLEAISAQEYQRWQNWCAPIPVIFRTAGALAAVVHPNHLLK
ncbi:GNAT family N-acetyltransferase [Acerihabitans sp. TG2]|uniref:tRNA(Met) cytidine acetyltransferase TmcA n=1 Tax=Acerihabitans sp. TG2 TaxID=3096008 RepID=UPI002B223D5A|nr:GNAT family N-acetyltransferase [Acerihabitans sp. TG2]MEA9389019.1 GNAT family N-acetyltransferase [Acerihabitans sp. TG2]